MLEVVALQSSAVLLGFMRLLEGLVGCLLQSEVMAAGGLGSHPCVSILLGQILNHAEVMCVFPKAGDCSAGRCFSVEPQLL